MGGNYSDCLNIQGAPRWQILEYPFKHVKYELGGILALSRIIIATACFSNCINFLQAIMIKLLYKNKMLLRKTV